MVHRAKDKCDFVKHHCPDEESGLISYLTLYYCRVPKAKPLGMTIIVIWTGLLFSTIGIAASDFFCINLSTISTLLGMSESLAGVTFLAFGNGSPDVFSTFAAVKSHSGSLAVGELIGAAGFITAVVAGSMALVRPFKVAKASFVRDIAFFIVAVSFSMVFMANGSLALWECAVMVGFYIFYVIVVVAWHWWSARRSRKQGFDIVISSPDALTIPTQRDVENFRDDDDTLPPNAALSSSATLIDENYQGRSELEALQELPEDLDENARMEAFGELNSNMRVTMAPDGERRPIYNPIRPSLVGALEFRAVLSAVEKEESKSAAHSRRFSDLPVLTSIPERFHTGREEDLHSDRDARSQVAQNGVDRGRSGLEVRGSIAARGRAVSVNDAAGLNIDPKLIGTYAVPDVDLLGASPSSRQSSRPSLRAAISQPDTLQLSDVFESLAPESKNDLDTNRPISRSRSKTASQITTTHHNQSKPRPSLTHHKSSSQLRRSSRSSQTSAQLVTGRPRAHTRGSTHLHIPQFRRPSPRHTPPVSPFLRYLDDPMQSVSEEAQHLLPPPSVSPGRPEQQVYYDDAPVKPWRWWPYKYTPPPEVIGRTLFPTLCDWRDKNIWDKMLGIVSAPSFFLLTITLPVVEPPEEDINDRKGQPESLALEAAISPEAAASTGLSGPVATTEATTSSPASREWNRWLVLVQCFTAPIFIALMIWANTAPDSGPNTADLLYPILYALSTSAILLIIVLLTSTPTQPPRYHFLLCFVGFTVSVTWISTIANEVVGVLKTIGVIFGISDAILGLTIFAVGSSLGDLVADITVARLGYPVMALSACFGGPLLNILLGIGLSGCYIILEGASNRQHRHPDKPVRFKPYHVEVSPTLVVSGVALLVTLVGLLVVVPLNGWKMDRKVGIGLMALWVVTTIGNVVVEVTGWGDDWDFSDWGT